MRKIAPNDGRIVWKNVAELVKVNSEFRLQRAPREWVSRFAEGAARRCLQSANARMLLNTDSKRVGIRWKNNLVWDRPGVLGEVLCNGEACGTFSCIPALKSREDVFETENEGANLWEIHFPWCAETLVESVLVEEGADILDVAEDRRDSMFMYGSSITQGFCATRAGGTWPCITASVLGVDFYNFGFGGAAYYEKEIAEYIVSRPDWKYLTVEAGTNTGGGYETPDSYCGTLNTFLDIIREKRPVSPILCFTSTYYIDQDGKGIKNSKGFLMEDYRKITREVVGRRMESDGNLFLAEGLDWVGSDKYLADVIHPDDEGMRLMGTGIAREWRKTEFFAAEGDCK